MLKFLLVALMAVVALASDAVKVLTDDDMDTFIGEHPNGVLVKFYAPWCGHCKKLEPEYEAAAEALAEQGSDVVLAKVDATVHREVSNKHNIAGYPTLKFFKSGDVREYDGGRSKDDILNWIKRNTGPAVVVVDSAEAVETFKSNNTEEAAIFAGYFTSADSDAYKNFESIADKSRDLGLFVATTSASADKISVTRKDEGTTDFTGTATDSDAVKAFVDNEAFALFAPISGQNFGRYMDRGLDIVWVAMTADEYQTYGDNIRTVAKLDDVRKTYSMVFLDVDIFAAHAEGALGVSSFPAVVIQKKDGRYVYPPEGSDKSDVKSILSVENVQKFFEDVAAGKIERSIKSADPPATNDEPVKVVVAKTFEEMVFHDDKFVMLEVYAPWCGHCKKLEPIYNELAEKIQDTHKNVIIAKMDGTKNESPVENFDWTGFPTIFWVSPKSRTPERYQGGRTVEDLLKFINEQTGHTEDAPPAGGETRDEF